MTKNKPYEIGQIVSWKWMGKTIIGIVKEIHYGPVQKNIKSKIITRNGSLELPAYLVETIESKKLALKLATEITKI